MKLHPRLLICLAALASFCLSAIPSLAAPLPPAIDARRSASSQALPLAGQPVFGPQLYLVSVQPGRLRSAPGLAITLHQRLSEPLMTGDAAPAWERYLASGTPEAAAQAAAAGLTVQLLDTDTRGRVYYLVDATAAGAVDVARQLGSVLYADRVQFLLAVPTNAELSAIERLLGQGAQLSRLDPTDVLEERILPYSPAAAQSTGADPYIAALLPGVTADELQGYMADLSGERAVDLGGRSATFHSRYLLSSNTADVETYLYRYYSGLGLATGYVKWSYGAYSGHNIIADLPGVTHPERIWLVGGHFDSQSTQTPTVTAPGADDNGSGTAATMVLAHVLRNQHFADTLRFVSFGGEEFGEWGSKSYAAALSAAGVQVMGYLDLDMIGYDGNGDLRLELHAGTGSASNSLAAAFISANSRYSQGLDIQLWQAGATNFSDHSSFWAHGYSSILAIEDFYANGSIAADRNPYYHSPGDLLARVSLDYVTRYARTALATVAELAGIYTGPVPHLLCQELLSNGSFEGDAGWTFDPASSIAGYTSEAAHGGSRSARLGLLPGQSITLTGASFAQGYQTVSLPVSADTLRLTYWYRPSSQATQGDYQRAFLLNPDTSQTIVKLMEVLESDGTWHQRQFDLSPYLGQTVLFYFDVYNDSAVSTGRTSMYLDDVSVQSCRQMILPQVAFLPWLLR